MISFKVSGSTRRTRAFLEKMQRSDALFADLDSLAQQGVTALRAATPIDSGLTAESWNYEIEIKNGSVTIRWVNTNTIDGVNVAVLIQYGHGTGTGGYVSGMDYINPAIRPIFDQIAEKIWERVRSA